MTIPGVMVAGNIVLDILTRPVDEITWGGTRWVESITQALGGNGANTASAIAKLGVPARLMGAVGPDAFGDAALGRLRECGVDTRLVAVLEAATATTVGLVRPDGARAFLHQPGVGLVFGDGHGLTAGNAEGCTRLHVGNPFALVHMRRLAPELLRKARELGLETSMDTAWDALDEWMKVVAPCLPHTGILFTNEDEARMLTGTVDPPLVARALRNAGAGTVVMKLGAKGCAVFPADGEGWEAPGYAVTVVDTTGAGDCFAGAYLAALQRGLTDEDASRVANAAGALNVQAVGGTTGLRTWEETLRFAGVRLGPH